MNPEPDPVFVMPHTTHYTLMDVARRQAGRALDAAGLGPEETPARIAGTLQGARLRAYQPAGRAPALLLVPAPIKRAYIWDLQPDVSVVRHALRRGFAVYLLEWLDPGSDENAFGLAEHALRLPLATLDIMAQETGDEAAIVAGHSLGGTFAAILAAVRPERVRGLVLVDAPLAFGPDRGGPLARMVGAVPHARLLHAMGGSPVPGSFLSLLSSAAVPDAFLFQRWSDLAASLADRAAAMLHARVERWLLDEVAMPARLFEEVLELLYREDQLARGVLDIAGCRAGLDRLRSPVLAIVNPAGRVVPPASVLAGLAALPREVPQQVLRHAAREPGPALQHLGPLIAPAAHAQLWPAILDWALAVAARH